MQIKRRPQFTSSTMTRTIKQLSDNNTPKYKHKFDRSRLPTPADYYKKEFEKLKIKSEWVKVNCCFHSDSSPSLSINMDGGYFRCFACGAKGCDVLAFHQLRYGLTFIEAVDYFGAWEHE